MTAAIAFLLLVALLLETVLYFSRNNDAPSPPKILPSDAEEHTTSCDLAAQNLLEWEFSYAATTASEAVNDRLRMLNFFLIIVAATTTLIAGLLRLGASSNVPNELYTAVLWFMVILGCFYFLKIIRLRQAWRESAKAMNTIKEAIIRRLEKPGEQKLAQEAIRWRLDTVPEADRQWNIFHYSALQIAFINGSAFAGGVMFLEGAAPTACNGWMIGGLGVVAFMYQASLYQRFLRA